MGVRDLLLGVGLLEAVRRGDRRAVSTSLSYGVAAGLVDATATALAYRSLPRSGRAFLLFIAAAALGDAYLARCWNRPTEAGDQRPAY